MDHRGFLLADLPAGTVRSGNRLVDGVFVVARKASHRVGRRIVIDITTGSLAHATAACLAGATLVMADAAAALLVHEIVCRIHGVFFVVGMSVGLFEVLAVLIMLDAIFAPILVLVDLGMLVRV